MTLGWRERLVLTKLCYVTNTWSELRQKGFKIFVLLDILRLVYVGRAAKSTLKVKLLCFEKLKYKKWLFDKLTCSQVVEKHWSETTL